MSGSAWGLVALAGLAVVVVGNLLRFRRTGDRGCLGHVFVSREQLNATEWALNRAGIVVFALGVALAIVV